MAAMAQLVPQEVAIREAVSSTPAPDGVRFQRLRFAEDHTGDPAVFVVYSLSEADKQLEERARALSAFRRAIVRSIWSLGLPFFPYVEFIEG